ncbi:elongation factor 1-alpha 1 [Culex quinquefasciatus]|uniref:Elongation factor 1-alpha 1 n=1 Tax=Culex quinquefasciatus TaxID=7176 RepID=B0WPT2_CULQU|nr:elongation factor 1-alpha 1 [Culex quinquefasciatus]|eukprot:XP_001850716.1 elongation factor 1-alpha 1 [Culex quinquefasciatus]
MLMLKCTVVAIVPISGWHGDNMLEPSTKMYLFQAWAIKPPSSGAGTGVNKPGIAIVFVPANLTAEVKSVEMHEERVRQGTASWNCELTAQVIVLNHPGQISNGYTPVLDCHTACEFSETKKKDGDI